MKASLYKHQEDALKWTLDRASRGLHWTPLFMETGTGKTLVALRAMEEFASLGRRKFLVVSPKALVSLWLDEADKWEFPMLCRGFTMDSSYLRELTLSKNWDVLCVNYDSVRLMESKLIAQGFDGVIFDELHKTKNADSKIAAACRRLVMSVQKRKGFVLGLTGTPVAHSPLDLWSEFDVLDPHFDYSDHPLGYGSFGSFENQVSVKIQHPHIRGVWLHKFPDDAIAELKIRVAQHAFECSKKECLDLPPQKWTPVMIDLHPEQRRIYNALRDQSVAFLQQEPTKPLPGILSMEQMVEEWQNRRKNKGKRPINGDRVSTTFQTVLMMRLHQVAAGHVKTDDGMVKFLPNAKRDYIEEMLPSWTDEYHDNKFLIMSRFRADVKVCEDLADKLKIKYVTVTGDNSKDAQKIANRFQREKHLRMFIGQVDAASTGLTLTAGNTMCFFSNSFNWVNRKQAEDRIHRISQLRPVEYIDLLARDTVDTYILEKLKKRGHLAARTIHGLIKILRDPAAAYDVETVEDEEIDEDEDQPQMDFETFMGLK